jgi:hypothetical protein
VGFFVGFFVVGVVGFLAVGFLLGSGVGLPVIEVGFEVGFVLLQPFTFSTSE